MKDQPLVNNIKIRYNKSHRKPNVTMIRKIIEIIKANIVKIIVVAFFVMIILLWIYGESK